MMLVYSTLFTLALLVSSPVWGWRMVRQGRYRRGLPERLGSVPARLQAHAEGRSVVWLHAVSVGELMAVAPLIAELEQSAGQYAVVVSTTTPAAQDLARERFGADRVFFYPLDFAFATRAYLRALRPVLLILVESELWPRMLVECARAQVPVAVVNARVSDRSLPRYMALRALWRPLLGRVSLMLAQSEEDARRWRGIGARRVEVTGNLKYDARSAEQTPLVALLRKHLPQDAHVLVCGSTHDGEEAKLLDCWRHLIPGASGVMILAPRHPDRAASVTMLARERGLPFVRLSEWRIAPGALAEGAVVVVDTVGELAGLYALAAAAFVGGSLIQHGGQNPLEPAAAGVPVIMGGSFQNFREVVAAMREREAITLVDDQTLCAVLRSGVFLGELNETGVRARAFFLDRAAATNQGTEQAERATDRTAAALLGLLERPS
jgi:3-deoxy-D-manno-octulosonic-acid transferase